MAPIESSTSSVDAMVICVRDFCAFVEGAHTLRLPQRLTAAREKLLALYTAAIKLPDVSPTDEDPPADTSNAPSSWRGFDKFEIYWEMFDPYEHEEPVAGSLSDDLLDVYRDLKVGLALWELGATADALWDWRFSCETHWGDHAIDALRALHRACGRAVPSDGG